MAEIQKTTNTDAGEMTQRFIEFVMMQSQNAALFLGQMPNPQTGEAEVNLEVARMFIDQLVMIREKTKGNLTTDEQKVLSNAIGGLQMAFVEVSKGGPIPDEEQNLESGFPPTGPEPVQESPKVSETGNTAAPATDATGGTDADAGSKKRFTKSYG